ncbi:aldehyde dehydrogenase domain-containing protein, partial [Phascolomyces articulosus]
VQEGICDRFLEKFNTMTLSGKVGNSFDEEDTFRGSQVSETLFKHVMEYIGIGKKEGATCYLGGKRSGTEGYFIEPTIFTDAKPNMRITKEEIFDPVVVISKFKVDVDGVVALANDTSYDLTASVLLPISRVTSMFPMPFYSVFVNWYNVVTVNSPFGGYKQSGIGRENNEYVFQIYTQVKAVKVNLGNYF